MPTASSGLSRRPARSRNSKLQPYLTKSRYLEGVQCRKRLWLGWHAADLARGPDETLQALFEAGREVGAAARLLFPGGTLVTEPPWAHAEAVTRTRDLMDDADVPAIFEGAFEWKGVRIRVDVLERLSGGAWGLLEVKASTRLKQVHVDDVSVQRFVLEGSGVSVSSVDLLHVDRDYARGDNGIDWPAFFQRTDLTAESAARLEQVPDVVEDLRRILGGEVMPDILPGRHCSDPYDCEFWDHCTRQMPDDWVFYLPGLTGDRLRALQEHGIECIPHVPEDFPLSATQARVCKVHRSGERYVSAGLASALGGLGPPAFYLDFETLGPAIPLYPGTRPYQAVPFQWSLHHVDSAGELTHREFLADGRGDPRRLFADGLIDALSGTAGPILVYSSFERTQLRALAELYPDLAEPIRALVDRLRDLAPVVRANLYDPAFQGSFSLKAVAPALAPCVTFDNLDRIAEGSAASSAMSRISRGSVDAAEEARLRTALLAYCQRDTLALVELHRVMIEAARR